MFKVWNNLATASMFEMTEEGWITVDVRDISDITTDIQEVKERMMLVGGLVANGWKVVVKCIAGINRSNVLVCGVMCMLEPKDDLDETWNTHWETVRRKVPRALANPTLYDTVKKVLWQTKRFKTWDKVK